MCLFFLVMCVTSVTVSSSSFFVSNVFVLFNNVCYLCNCFIFILFLFLMYLLFPVICVNCAFFLFLFHLFPFSFYFKRFLSCFRFLSTSIVFFLVSIFFLLQLFSFLFPFSFFFNCFLSVSCFSFSYLTIFSRSGISFSFSESRKNEECSEKTDIVISQ
jgi:hypothetical protein